MEYKLCPKCGKANDKYFVTCSKCRAALPDTVLNGNFSCLQEADNVSAPDTTESLRAEMAFKKKIKEYIEKGVELDECMEAALFAECVELQVLKAPASAIFPDLDEMVVNGKDGKYIVSGYVDAQNSHGALIRENYTYSVMKCGDRWRCSDTFVSSKTVAGMEVAATMNEINKVTTSYSILWWILGLIGTGITWLIIKSSMGF